MRRRLADRERQELREVLVSFSLVEEQHHDAATPGGESCDGSLERLPRGECEGHAGRPTGASTQLEGGGGHDRIDGPVRLEEPRGNGDRGRAGGKRSVSRLRAG